MDDITAYHESGHAVMAIRLGGVVQHISLRPESSVDWDDDLPRFGDTTIAWPTAQITSRQHAEREVQTALAGPVSEIIYNEAYIGDTLQAESAADWQAASHHASTFISDDLQRAEYLAETLHHIEAWLRNDLTWAAVAALADELVAHEQLDSETVHAAVTFWFRHQ